MAKFLKLRVMNKATETEEEMLLNAEEVSQFIECRELSKIEKARALAGGLTDYPGLGKAGTMICTTDGSVVKVVEPIHEVAEKLSKLGIEMV